MLDDSLTIEIIREQMGYNRDLRRPVWERLARE
jgi:hypothetical protein